jgi:hypothetical protein
MVWRGVVKLEVSVMRTLILFCLATLVFCTSAVAADKREAIFEVSLDMDRNGTNDRAVLVLVGPGRDKIWDLARGVYPLSENETLDLEIYLGSKDQPIDIAKPPTIRKQSIIDKERTRWVQSLEVVNNNTLKLSSNYQPGSSHDEEETLIIVHRNGQFLVGGLNTFWENPNGIGNCQLNLFTGKGIRAEGEFPGPKPNFKAEVKPVPLVNWSEKTRPKQCDQRD